MYRYLKDFNTAENRTDAVQRIADGATIPNDPLNRDWREYQGWLTAGNTPQPAE